VKEIVNKIILRIRIAVRKYHTIPEISEKREVIEYCRKLFNPKTMVETGTFMGETVEYFKTKFEYLISVELSEELAERASKKFINDKNVRIIQGDSSIVLLPLLKELNGPVLFWLDGHYSSEFFYGGEFITTAKGKIDTPVDAELEIILQVSVKPVILIDDARLFNGKNHYPTLNAIKKKVKSVSNDFSVFVKKDIIHILPHKK
jgi:hypothetical protein